MCFFFNDTATTEIYTLSLHDALPIYKLWVWKARDRASGRVVDWECGGRDAGTLSRLRERVERWNPRLYCADDWAAYAELIPQGRLLDRKSTRLNSSHANISYAVFCLTKKHIHC